jgi:hypothetical protein
MRGYSSNSRDGKLERRAADQEIIEVDGANASPEEALRWAVDRNQMQAIIGWSKMLRHASGNQPGFSLHQSGSKPRCLKP